MCIVIMQSVVEFQAENPGNYRNNEKLWSHFSWTPYIRRNKVCVKLQTVVL